MAQLNNDLMSEMLGEMETACGTPYAYLEFESAPGVESYIAYYEDQPDQLGADDVVWYSGRHFTVELYTPIYNPELEQTLTGIFDSHEVFWRRGPQVKIDSENMIQTVFYL